VLKIGDKVLIKYNSHYPKPKRIVRIEKSLWDNEELLYALYGVKLPWNKDEYSFFKEEDLVPEEIWNSPLYKSLKE
jgi:hypothetical protein